MANPFASPTMAAGYARCRPALHPRIMERVRELLQITTMLDRALDVGCGSGLSTAALQPLAQTCIGIDPAVPMLLWAHSVAPGSYFVAGNAESLPLHSGSIDLLTAAGSLNYADLSLFFPEALRVLAPSGVLVVYDFSEGRRFRKDASLENWYSEFQRLYPVPLHEGHEISPEILRECDSDLRLAAHEYFEIGLLLEPDFYLDYVMTETNVAHAIRNGVAEGEIRDWCAATLQAVFQGEAREVLFSGYIAVLMRARSTT
jgi:SAM-dependent methyltransferase